MIELTPLQKAQAELRVQRDKLLAETDWVVTKSTETGEPIPLAFVAYRGQLRDLPANAVIEVNKYGYLDWSKIVMPQKPE